MGTTSGSSVGTTVISAAVVASISTTVSTTGVASVSIAIDASVTTGANILAKESLACNWDHAALGLLTHSRTSADEVTRASGSSGCYNNQLVSCD